MRVGRGLERVGRLEGEARVVTWMCMRVRGRGCTVLDVRRPQASGASAQSTHLILGTAVAFLSSTFIQWLCSRSECAQSVLCRTTLTRTCQVTRPASQ